LQSGFVNRWRFCMSCWLFARGKTRPPGPKADSAPVGLKQHERGFGSGRIEAAERGFGSGRIEAARARAEASGRLC